MKRHKMKCGANSFGLQSLEQLIPLVARSYAKTKDVVVVITFVGYVRQHDPMFLGKWLKGSSICLSNHASTLFDLLPLFQLNFQHGSQDV